MRSLPRTSAFFLCVAIIATVPAFGQEDDGAAMAKELSNPISDLVSVPFQMNWEQGVGPTDQTRFILNVQPVIPFSLNEHWNMIARIIMPFLSQPSLAPGVPADFGVSDVLASLFFSPRHSAIVWGIGPVLSLPSTAQPTLGTGKWSAGPTAVVLKQQSGWTYGKAVVVRHISSELPVRCGRVRRQAGGRTRVEGALRDHDSASTQEVRVRWVGYGS
jgi:hypothetical protein